MVSTLGGSVASLGIIEGIADALAGVFRLVGGALADDPDRRRAVAIGGYTSTAVLTAAIGFAQTVWQVAFLRAGAWVARGIRVPSRNALLADAVSSESYGRAYGFERMADNLGAIGEPLLALGLVALFSVRTAMLVSVIPGILAAVAIAYAVRHIPRSTVKERQKIRLRVRPVIRGPLGRLMWSVSAFEMGNVAATLLILRATQLLEPSHGLARATEIGILLYLGYNVSATVISLPAGHVIDKLGATLMFGTGPPPSLPPTSFSPCPAPTFSFCSWPSSAPVSVSAVPRQLRALRSHTLRPSISGARPSGCWRGYRALAISRPALWPG